MTESEWQASNDPQMMLSHLRDAGVTDRKMRLFACACCRRVWDQFPDRSNQDLVVAVEDYPDATFDHPVIHAAAVASSACEGECSGVPAYWVAKYLGRGFYKFTAAMSAAIVAAKAMALGERGYRRRVEEALYWAESRDEVPATSVGLPRPVPDSVGAEAAAQAGLLRCVFGSPFSPAQFQTAWRTEAVLLLAREAYQSRDFSAMPVLADALEEAGCTDETVLSHCRSPGVHARGCHVVDFVLDLK